MKPTRLSLLRAASAMALVTSPAVHAASGTWNVDASGTWSTPANWAGTIADASGSTANFTFDITADRTVTLDTSRTLTGLVFTDTGTASNNWILTRSGSALLTLAGTGPSINVTNQTATVSAIIAGTTGWTKSGAGTLTLSGANTSTGNVTLSGGVLAATMGNGLTGPLGSSTAPATVSKQLTIINNAVFRSLGNWNNNPGSATVQQVVLNIGAGGGTFDTPASTTMTLDDGTGTGTGNTAAQLQGSGNLTKTGAGTLSLGNAASSFVDFTGQISINAGVLRLGAVAAAGVPLGATSAGTVIASGAAFDIGANLGTAAEPLTIQGSGVGGTGNVIFTSATTATPIFAGPITLAGSSTIGSTTAGTITFNGTSTFALGSNTLTIRNTSTGRIFTDGIISGIGSVAMNSSGTGDYVPRADHTYSGGTNLTAGFIAVDRDSIGTPGSPTSGPFGTGTLNLAGAQLRAGTVANRTIGNSASLLADTIFYSVALEKNLSFSGPVTLVGGNRTITSNVGATVATSTVLISGNIGDAGANLSLIKAGTGNLSLSGTNTYGGSTTVSAGALIIASSASVPGFATGSLGVSSGATVAFGNAVTDGEIASLLGSTSLSSGASIGFDTSVGDRTYSNNLANTAQGPLGLVKMGANRLTLSGANTYTGTTTVVAGTLVASSSASLPGFATNGGFSVASGATLAVGNGVTDGEITTLLGTTNFGVGSSLGFDTSAGDRTFGVILGNTSGGALNLIKLGSNRLTLTGANTYTGTTTVAAGTLVAAGGSAALGNIVVGNSTANAVLNVPLGGTMTGGTITAGTANGSFGAVNVTGGTLILATPETTDTISFGNADGGYGAFTISGGTFTQSRLMFGGTGSSVAGGTGVGLIAGGTVNSNGWLILSRAGGSTGTLTITGGTLNHAGATQDIVVGLGTGTPTANTGRAELNVAGGLLDNTGRRVTFSGGTGGTFHWSGTGLVNLNGGTLLTNSITYDTATSPFSPNANSYVNFGGGTLKAATSSAIFFPAHTPTGTGVSQVYVNGAFGSFTGGAIIDTNGFDNTISANFLAPSGNGVTGLTIDSAGSGYIGAPAVKILDGGLPSTASAYAVVGTDPAIPATFGKVTSVVITNPGVIVGTPSISLVGGGGTGAAISVSSTGANTSGGLTKTGAGQLTLTGNSTYTGLTSVSTGTLAVAGSGTLAASSGLSVSSGASFFHTPPATTLAFGAGSTLALASNSTIGVSYGSTIAVSGAATVSGTVNLVLSGAYTSTTPYTVLTAGSGLNSGTYKVLNAADFTYTVSVSPTAVTITPTTAPTPLANAHWRGGFAGQPAVWSVSDGSSASNWTTDGAGTATPLVPGTTANVFFSDASAAPANQLGMTLGSNMSIGSLAFNSVNPVSLLNSDISVLTIAGGLTVSAPAGSVTLSANIALTGAQTWTNNSANPLVTGLVSNGANLLTLSGSGNITIGNFNGGIGGLTVDSTGFRALGASTLAGAQTWTNNGVNPLGVGAIANAGFALALAGTGNFDLGGVVSGTGALTKSGSGTATLSAANTYSGGTTIAEGTLTLSGARTGNSGNLTVSNLPGLSAILNISDGTYAFAGSSAMNIGNAPTTAATGTVNQTGGAISFAGGNQVLVGQNTVGNQGVYNMSGGSITTIANVARGVMLGVNSNPAPGPASGGGTFNLSGTGVLNMVAGGNAILQIGRSDALANNTTNAFNQTGGTANVGILAMGGAAASGSTGVSSTLNLIGGTFSANSFTLLSAGGTNDSTINIGGTADVTLPGFPTVRGASSTATLTLDGGTLRPSAASATYISALTNAFIKANGANFDVPTGRNITVSQALLTDPVSLGGGLSKSEAGVLTLSGANTYTGSTTVTGGGLLARTLASLPGIATLHKISLSGSSTLTLGVGGADEFTSADVDSVRTNADFNTGTALGFDTANAVGGTFTYASNISNASGVAGTNLGLAKSGANTLVLAGSNTYSGPTTITGGILEIGVSNNLGDASPTNSINLAGGTFSSGSSAFTLNNSRAVNITAGAGFRSEAGGVLTITTDLANGANNLAFTGAGSIIVNGVIGTGVTPTGAITIGSSTQPANVTLNGNNLFTGNVSLPASNTQPFAVLTVTHSGALGVGPKTVASQGGGEIHLQNNITLAANISFSTSGNPQQNGVAGVNRPVIANDSGNNAIDGNISMTSGNGGTIISSDNGLLTLNGNLTPSTTGRQLQVRGNSNGIINGVIANGPTVNMPVLKDEGSGTWTFNGVNTYSGTTTVSAGTLALGNAAALGTGAAIVNAGGSLDLGGQAVANAVTVNAAGTLTGSGAAGAATLAGTVTPGGSGNGLITVASATVASTANLGLQLGGTGIRGTHYDALTVNGALALDGTVTVTLNGLVPAAAQTFDLIDSTGAIDITNFNINTDLVLPPAGTGLAWDISSFATNGQITVVVFVDPFIGWANANGVVQGKAGDDDGDGTTNLVEFATNSNPKSGSSGARVYGLLHPIGGSPVLTYTVATRAAAAFAANGSKQEATKDLVKYTIEGTNDLSIWNSVVVTEVTGADATAARAAIVPPLPTLDAGWEWHTFRTDDNVTVDPRDFIRLNVAEAP